jgi:thymidine kinase
MFLEPHQFGRQKGWMEVICGGMFSGKSEELIRRLRRVQIAGKRVEIFKPTIDTRYSGEHIVSHNDSRIPCTPVVSSGNILLLASGVDVVGIDEAQFFDDGITEVVDKLMMQGVRVIVAGLDMDYTAKPFGPIPQLLASAEYITKLHAICVQCGDLASYSYRKSAQEDLVHLGEQNDYEPRCRHCFYK